MPIYDYYCEDCDHRFEEYHQMMDDEGEECPKCKKVSPRVQHFSEQRLKSVTYVAPPRATRKLGEEIKTPHVRKSWA